LFLQYNTFICLFYIYLNAYLLFFSYLCRRFWNILEIMRVRIILVIAACFVGLAGFAQSLTPGTIQGDWQFEKAELYAVNGNKKTLEATVNEVDNLVTLPACMSFGVRSITFRDDMVEIICTYEKYDLSPYGWATGVNNNTTAIHVMARRKMLKEQDAETLDYIHYLIEMEDRNLVLTYLAFCNDGIEKQLKCILKRVE